MYYVCLLEAKMKWRSEKRLQVWNRERMRQQSRRYKKKKWKQTLLDIFPVNFIYFLLNKICNCLYAYSVCVNWAKLVDKTQNSLRVDVCEVFFFFLILLIFLFGIRDTFSVQFLFLLIEIYVFTQCADGKYILKT